MYIFHDLMDINMYWIRKKETKWNEIAGKKKNGGQESLPKYKTETVRFSSKACKLIACLSFLVFLGTIYGCLGSTLHDPPFPPLMQHICKMAPQYVFLWL